MEEAKSREVPWEDVDEDTFARFAQFVYTGDYVPAAHVSLDPEVPATAERKNDTYERPEVESPPPQTTIDYAYEDTFDQDVCYGSRFGSTKSKKDKKRNMDMSKPESVKRRPFFDRNYPLPASLTCCKERCKARANTSASEDYTPVFLGHTHLYAFADKYGIESLKLLVLNKLHETLRLFTPYEARYGDILELLRDTYDRTPTRPQLDPLRELVTQYVAFEAKEVINTEQCLSLVNGGGELARDLYAMLLKQLAT
ncbi:hypothetical protein MMC32_005249 [Xylographa parallela]|nr:hypothetical protein [Xylographa parallela]